MDDNKSYDGSLDSAAGLVVSVVCGIIVWALVATLVIVFAPEWRP